MCCLLVEITCAFKCHSYWEGPFYEISQLLGGPFNSKITSPPVLWYFSLAGELTWFGNKKQHWFLRRKMIPISQNKSQTDSNCSFSHLGLALLEGVDKFDRTFPLRGLVIGNRLFLWVKLTFKSHFKTDLKVSLKVKVLWYPHSLSLPSQQGDASLLMGDLLLWYRILSLLYSHTC